MYPPLARLLPKSVSKAKPRTKAAAAKGVAANNQEAAYEAAMNEFFDRIA